jgi:hypothetical protein
VCDCEITDHAIFLLKIIINKDETDHINCTAAPSREISKQEFVKFRN